MDQKKYEKFCQSCSMPLKGGMEAGTESDGSKNTMYCHYCYKDGKFTNPDATLEDMKKILDDTIGKKGIMGKVFAWLGKRQLPNLKRWKK